MRLRIALPRLAAALTLTVCVLVLVPAPALAARMGNASIAALQVALRARGVYDGTVDGFVGPGTATAVRRLQRHAGIAVDGVAGAQTLHVLGRRGRPRLGARPLREGRSGFD